LGLVVVAIFDEVYEGEVAASLLRSSGMPVWLMGDQLAKFYPFKQRAWGGVRLSVPAEDAPDAVAILQLVASGALQPEAPSDIPPVSESRWWTVGALVLAFGTTIESGWAVSGLRRRRTALQIAGTPLLAMIAATWLLSLVIGLSGMLEPAGA
jgi:hypothetical protein